MDDCDRSRARLAASDRVLVRLTHSLAEDEEIHGVLPDTDEEFDALVLTGELKELGPRLAKILAGWD